MEAREVVRTVAVLLVWGVWLLAMGLRSVLLWLWEGLRSAWPRRLLWAGLLILLLDVGIQLLPLVYGRFALLDEAAFQARTCSGRDPAQIVATLRRAAFQNGFTDVIHQDAAITVDYLSEEDGGASCAITVSLEQKVPLLVQVPLTFRVNKRVQERILPMEFKPRTLEEPGLGD